MKKIIILSLLFFLFLSCGRNRVLAEFNQGSITEKDLQELIEIFYLEAQAKSERWKKQAVRQLVLNQLLTQKAKKKQIHQLPAAKAMKTYLTMYLIRMNLEKSWQKAAQKQPVLLYKARHILRKVKHFKQIKQGGVEKSIPLTELEKIEKTAAIYREINQIREKILSGELTFEKAAQELSEDPSSKDKGGDLGHFPEGTMVPEFQRALYRLAQEVSFKALYRVQKKEIPLLAKANLKAPTLFTLKQYQILPVQDEQTFLKVNYQPHKIGYVLKNAATRIEIKETPKLSLPILTMYGWHLIRLEEVKRVSPEQYITFVMQEKFAQETNPREKAKSFVQQQLARAASLQVQKKAESLLAQFQLNPNKMPSLPPRWRSQKILYKKGDLKLTKAEFEAYLQAQETFNPEAVLDLKKNPQEMQRWQNSHFQKYLELKAYEATYHSQKPQENSTLKRQVELSFQPYLARLYKLQFWYQELKPVSAQAIQKEYAEMKKRARGQNFPPLRELYNTLKRRIRMRERRNIDKVKEENLLKQVGFQLHDENFKV